MSRDILQAQRDRVARLLREEGMPEKEIESTAFLGPDNQLMLAHSRREADVRVRAKIPHWVAAGLMTETEAAAMSTKELQEFLRYEEAATRFEKDRLWALDVTSERTPEVVTILRDIVSALEAFERGTSTRDAIANLKRRVARL
jgi:hypothetical protein